MRDSHSPTPRASWRKSARSVTPAAEAGEFGSRGRQRRHLLFRVSALVTLAIGMTIILAWVLRLRPDRDVPLIVAAVSQSAPRLGSDPLSIPPNPFGKEDARWFRAWFNREANQHVEFLSTVDEQTGPMEKAGDQLIKSITTHLASAVAGGPRGDMITVFVTAQGLVHEGEPYLIVGDSQPGDASTWVSVESLLKSIIGKLKKDNRVVLFLDATRGGTIWDWGKLDDSFTDRVDKVVTRESEGRIAVIVSSSEGQRSWWDPRRGRSLFAKAIIQSLTGSGDTNEDGYITVGEVAADIRRQVSTDAQAIWDARQHPVLLSKQAADWRLIQKPDKMPSPNFAVVDADRLSGVFDEIDELWDQHNAIAKTPHPPLATNPLAWSVLEKQLTRLDQLALAGQAYEEERKTLQANCNKLLGEFKSGSPRIPNKSALPELRLVDYFYSEPEPDSFEQPTNQALTELAAAWAKDPTPETNELGPELGEEQVTRMLWTWLIDKQFEPGSLAAAASLLDRVMVNPNQPARFVETHLIRLLTAPDISNIRGDRAVAILQSHRASREAAFTKDLRASFWTRNAMSNLDRQRMMFCDAALAHAESGGAETKLSVLSMDDYPELRDRGQKISDAYRLRDQMFHDIPRMAETLLADVGAFEDKEKGGNSAALILAATDAVRCLAARLRLVDAEDNVGFISNSPINEISRAKADAEAAMQRLNLRLSERVDVVSGTKASDESGLRQAVSLLQGSGVSIAAQRRRIHQRLVELIGQDQADLTISQNATGGSVPSEPDDQWIENLNRSIRIQDQHPWVYWLTQTKELTCAPSGTVALADGEQPPLSESFDSQGTTLRKSIVDLVARDFGDVTLQPDKLSKQGVRLSLVRNDVEELETNLRCQTVMLSHRPKAMEDAVEQRFSLDMQLFVMEQAARTLREFWCEARANEQPFFAQASERLLRVQSFKPFSTKLEKVDLLAQLTESKSAVKDLSTLTARPAQQTEQRPLLQQVAGRSVAFQLARPQVLPSGQVSVWTDQDSKLLSLNDSIDKPLNTPFMIAKELSTLDNTFPVQSFFRGLRRRGGLTVRIPRNPRTVLFQLPNYGPPLAIVQADEKHAEKIVLVFDCSGSMKGSRLNEALAAVKKFLLSLPNDYSIGLVLFGHRYGWVQNGEYMVKDSRDSNKWKVFTVRGGQKVGLASLRVDDRVANHNPNFDVEAKVDLGPLNQGHLQRLIAELDDLSAVGVTPTYQGINKAYEMFGGLEGRIIVLTDGKPQLSGGFDTTPFRQQAMANFARSKDISLSIVNFANQDPQADLKLAFPGCVSNAKDAAELTNLLQDTSYRPRVAWKRDGKIQSDEVEFGSTVVLDRWPPTGQGHIAGQPVRPAERYEIEARGRSEDETASTVVHVEGGEAFELQLRDGKLLHAPFPRRLHVFSELDLDGADQNRYSVIALPPNVNNNRELTLKLVVENQSPQMFTPRPSDAWIDLVGFDAQRRRKIHYSISQPQYESSRGVPMLICNVDDWPDWASNVQIEAWFRFGDPEAVRKSLPLQSQDSVKLESIPGVSFRIERTRDPKFELTVTETYTDSAPEGGLRLLADPLPDQQVTRSYQKEGVVQRVFQYEQPPENLRVFVTKRSEITDLAPLHGRGSIAISGR
ncbi:von Willebrand factor type A domain protein [Planctomycetes bacterium CA13]|uniref:von Willebrand factor type A domain protein n=1 Tax=Novipirellula herctigrandis TaxID=2527986 RepID=A0A5C5Z5K3_9BACT|nr:von Willebrand factor type A domain protein [Planctomycetes bacterium CA13]